MDAGQAFENRTEAILAPLVGVVAARFLVLIYRARLSPMTRAAVEAEADQLELCPPPGASMAAELRTFAARLR